MDIYLRKESIHGDVREYDATWSDAETFHLTPAESLGGFYRFWMGDEDYWFDDLTSMPEEEFNKSYYEGQREFQLTWGKWDFSIRMGEYL